MFRACPKCWRPLDAKAAPSICPGRGLVFAKYLAAQRGARRRDPGGRYAINLVFHEASHEVFWPLGNFLMIAGGTLMQWLMPVAAVVALRRQRRNRTSESVRDEPRKARARWRFPANALMMIVSPCLSRSRTPWSCVP